MELYTSGFEHKAVLNGQRPQVKRVQVTSAEVNAKLATLRADADRRAAIRAAVDEALMFPGDYRNIARRHAL